MSKDVYIMQGVSGSGKSTAISNFMTQNSESMCASKVKVVSADSYFINRKGEYFYDASQAKYAHAQCMRDFAMNIIGTIDDGFHSNIVIVDNMNLTEFDIAQYYGLAKAWGWEVTVFKFVGIDLTSAVERSTHGLTQDEIGRQFHRWLNSHLPSFIRVVTVPKNAGLRESFRINSEER